MNFGTLQSISKETTPTSQVDTNGEFEFDTGTDDGVDLNMEPKGEPGGMEDIASKLIDLKGQIEDILSYLGYDDTDVDVDVDVDADFDDEPTDTDFDGMDGADLTTQDDDDFDFEAEDEGFDPEDEDQNFFDDGQIDGDESADIESPEENPDYQGNIRTVAGANLVYKRKGEDGNYDELWIYNVGNDIRQEMQIRRAILAGTDIVPTQTESDDGTQKAETYTLGNVQYLKITGLPH